MSSFAPWDFARSLLKAANLVPADHIHCINEPFLQPQDNNWLSIEAYSNILNPIDLGAKVYQERGRFIVYCIAPFGTGTDTLRILAKNVANLYRGLGPTNPFFDNVSIGLGSSSETGDAYAIPVTIAFTYQDISA